MNQKTPRALVQFSAILLVLGVVIMDPLAGLFILVLAGILAANALVFGSQGYAFLPSSGQTGGGPLARATGQGATFGFGGCCLSSSLVRHGNTPMPGGTSSVIEVGLLQAGSRSLFPGEHHPP